MPNHSFIVCHNLSGYDVHLFIKELRNTFNKVDFGVNAQSKEKFITFNAWINVKLAGLTKQDGKEVRESGEN